MSGLRRRTPGDRSCPADMDPRGGSNPPSPDERRSETDFLNTVRLTACSCFNSARDCYRLVILCLKKIIFVISLFIMPVRDTTTEDIGDVLREENQWTIVTLGHWIVYHSFLITVCFYTVMVYKSPKLFSFLGLFMTLLCYIIFHSLHLLILMRTYCRKLYIRRMMSIIDLEEPSEAELKLHHKKVVEGVWNGLSIRTLPLFSHIFKQEVLPMAKEFGKFQPLVKERTIHRFYRQKTNHAIKYIEQQTDKTCRAAFYVTPSTLKTELARWRMTALRWFERETSNCGRRPGPYLEEIEAASQKIEEFYTELNERKLVFTASSEELGVQGEEHLLMIRKSSVVLIQSLELDPLFVVSLVNKGVISLLFSEYLKNELIPRATRVQQLIVRLLQYPRANFEGFRSALEECNQRHLADVLTV